MSDSLFSEKWPLLSPYDRRRFLKQATAFGVSSTAFAAFLEACGSSGSSTTTGAGTANLAGPIDLQNCRHAVYWVQLRMPGLRPLLDFLSLVPFAVPPVVMSLGLLQVYGNFNWLTAILSLGLVPVLSNDPFNIVNTPPLLVCAYVIVSLPFVYRPIDNSLRAVNTRVLSEAASSLGSGWWRTFLTVVLPNIWPGVISAALLTFSTAMGEFTLASLFGIYTFPIYLDETGQNDAHKAASLAILSFIITLVCVLGIILLVRQNARRIGQKGEVEIAAAK